MNLDSSRFGEENSVEIGILLYSSTETKDQPLSTSHSLDQNSTDLKSLEFVILLPTQMSLSLQAIRLHLKVSKLTELLIISLP